MAAASATKTNVPTTDPTMTGVFPSDLLDSTPSEAMTVGATVGIAVGTAVGTWVTGAIVGTSVDIPVGPVVGESVNA
jgi:hypothetical protein